MAAVIDMGEVDEIHSKEETIKDGIILNGDVSSVKSNEEEEEEEENGSVPNEEVMEVEETQESDDNDVEATSIEIDDEDSNDSNAVILSQSETNEKDDNDEDDVIHSVDNSDDDIDEIVDELIVKEKKDYDEDEDDTDDVVHVITEKIADDDDGDDVVHVVTEEKKDEEEDMEDVQVIREKVIVEEDTDDVVHVIADKKDSDDDADDADDVVHVITTEKKSKDEDNDDVVHVITDKKTDDEDNDDVVHVITDKKTDDEDNDDVVHVITEKKTDDEDNDDVVHVITDKKTDDEDNDDVVHVITEKEEDQTENVDEEEEEKDTVSAGKVKDEETHSKEGSIILNDSGDGDVEIIESDLPKENGKSFSPELNETHKIDDDDEDEDDDDEIITLDSTPIKKAKKQTVSIVESPRRSARNLNKKSKKTYVEKEDKESSAEESDIEEVMPQDPLAVSDPLSTHEKVITYGKKQPIHIPVSSTIVVKDTKRLVEIASKSTPNNSGKKEPTLVIIDTNSILSGRGPIPITQKPAISQSFPVLPMALPAQGVYPPNMRATITPIPPMNSAAHIAKSSTLQSSSSAIQFPSLPTQSIPTTITSQNAQQQQTHQQSHQQPQQSTTQQQPQQQPPPAPILPSLTDDMFVVEAPSFIVPYVYEKPPVKDLREFVDNFAKEIRERIRVEERERRHRLEVEEKERLLAEQKEKESNETDQEKIKSAEEAEKEDGKQDSEEKKDEENVDSKKETEVEKIDDKKQDVEVALEKSIIPKKSEDKNKIEQIKSIVENKLSDSKEVDKKDLSRLIADIEEPVRSSSSSNKPYSYFDSPLGKFFIDIGHSLVQEFVQTDLLKQQKRKREREGGKNPETNKTISSLIKNLEYTKENNEPYHMPIKKCEFCSFKTESALAMSFHLETPHMKNFVYRCNFCPYEIRSPHDILFHMEAEHMIRGRLERAPAFHQCPNCPFEDNQKGKLSRHLVACSRKFKPERNLDPPLEWEPPAKIPRVPRMKQSNLTSTAAMYQAMAKSTQYQLMQKMQNTQSALNRGRGRPSLGSVKQPPLLRAPTQSMIYKSSMSGGSVLLPTNYQLSGNQLYQVVGGQDMGGRIGTGAPMTLLPNISSATSTLTIQQQTTPSKAKPMHQPSISITPLPRNTSAPQAPASKPGDSNSKNSFVICEICDGYIKDLEQLRNHMQWIHKVKIHPKMIYNRPPLNCQKCQFRFFTDQGLERHLLGSHGLVTSSMQEAANKSKDSGRCPVCGRVYQWKLLNHVARDHNMTLKPAHLSYKCTVCTATFGMYKQFENHVYSAHSVVAKRVMDKKAPSAPQASSNSSATAKNNDSLLKPLKINDEITIIPQLPKSSSGTSSTKEDSSASSSTKNSISVTTTPSTSKTELTRAERLARRKTSAGLDN